MIISFIVLFFSGAFLCNSLPHLVAGLQGRPFPTPFAQPRGVGESPAMTNFLWGFLNLVIGVLLLSRQRLNVDFYPNLTALLLGIFVMGLYLAYRFAQVRGGRP
jgi:hypothetical protein